MAHAICCIDDCGIELVPPYGRGMCSKHYQRWRKHGDPLYVYVRSHVVGVAECSIDGCSRIVQARGWCSAHWSRWQRHGSPTFRFPWEVLNGKRTCPTCAEDKPLTDWPTSAKGECKSCGIARAAEYRERNPYTPVERVQAICAGCGSNFQADTRRWRYCSIECADANRNRDNWHNVVIRRARIAGAFVEDYDRFEIFDRDGWICALCSEPIDPDLRWPDGMSASLDHIMPVSRGGKHSRANAQASHLVCNVRKGVRIA